ncbi:TonB-dependent receptor plug [Gemmatirosa kalamazoonensis]|uniref:TonB-dependent receptor plug n=1 Tax=Gemmatirosa kalamazoonensis TaxID=861299 RepID=W0RKM7_9BACT|nr:TonB-dependent receptor [Gemmatirosa kalamazoonensis]AHG91639.1 TonB-dependent receptor plug [Gemmatirosa kalamazoonensis]
MPVSPGRVLVQAQVLALALSLTMPLRAQTVPAARLDGVVTDSASGEAVRATVTLAPGGHATRTNAVGRFAFVDVAPGELTVTTTAVGYRAARTTVRLPSGTSTSIQVTLARTVRELELVRTRAERSPERAQAAAPAGPSVTSLGAREMSVIPAVGETDVLRAASLLPGIAARNDFWAGFNVRGGESDQTQVRLDGMPVFSPFHLGGLFSTFIPEAVGEVEARAGALPASHGGRLSGTLDVESSRDDRDGVHGAVDLSVISATAKLGGALGRGGSWNVAARRTYADALAAVVMEPGAFPYHFQDAQVHATTLVPGGGTVEMTAYAGLDLLEPTAASTSDVLGGEGNTFRFDWGNRLVGAALTQPLGPTAEAVQRVSWSAFSTAYDDDSTGVRLANRIGELRVSGELTRRFGRGDTTTNALRAGYELSLLRTRYDEHISSLGADELGATFVIDDTLVRQRSGARALFVEDVWTPNARLSVRPGVRVEQVRGADWRGVSPRLAVKYKVRDDLALSFATGRYAQWVHAVRNEDLPLRIVDVWFASDANVPVSTGMELVGGGELWLTGDDFVRVEAYTKRFDDLVEPASTVDPRLRPAELRRFGGTSRGVEVLVRHLATARLSGWISYSYARAPSASRRRRASGTSPRTIAATTRTWW